jgi:hypothetical protein
MIRNVVFEVGNVFVRWSPPEVVRRCFVVPGVVVSVSEVDCAE